MRWALDPIDVLFAHPNYGPISIILFVDAPIDAARFRAAHDALFAANPILGARLEREPADDGGGARLYLTATGATPTPEITALPTEAWDRRDQPKAWVAYNPELDDAARGPMLRLHLLQIGARSAVIANLAHCLGDGVSLLILLGQLGRAYRGQALTALPCDRAVLAEAIRALPEGGRARAGHSSIADKQYFFEDGFERHPVAPFPDDLLEAARARHPDLTRFEVHAAHVAMERHRRQPSPTLSLAVPINLRGLIPGVPVDYLGNAAKAEIFALDVDRVAAGDVAAVAAGIHGARRAVDRLAFRDLYDQLWALYAMAGPDAIARLRVSGDEAIIVTDMTALPGDVAFDGVRPTLVSFLSRYPNTVVLARSGERFTFQLGTYRAPAAT